MAKIWLYTVGRLWLCCLIAMDYAAVAIAEEAIAFGAGSGGGTSSAAGGLLHHVGKRMELQSCIVRFDVKLDMIIRTEESRAMGAKFLDHADLGSREECLRLCCETEDCDVFVFEEKNEGTCFLFQCGPAQNFRCKFTHHANYTSAVMTQPVQKPEPPPTPPPPPPRPVPSTTTTAPVTVASRSKHEMELSNLLEEPSPSNTANVIIKPPLSGAHIGIVSADKKAVIISSSSACSRFQFQCHSGECIAVYNACDGIPQCVDGSDEGPECPSTPTVAPIRMQQLPAADTIPIDMRLAAKPMDEHLPMHPLQQQQIQQQLLATVERADQNSQSGSASGSLTYGIGPIMSNIQHNREDPMTAPEWPSPLQTAQQQLQLQQQQQQQQQQIQQLQQSSSSLSAGQIQMASQQAFGGNSDSRIFSHKGGLQLAENSAVNPSSLNVNSLAQQYITSNNNNNGYAPQFPSLQHQLQSQQQQQQPPPPLRDPYIMQPMQDVYRIPQWSDPQLPAAVPQWPQEQVQQQQQSQSAAAKPLVPTRDEIIQLQQQPEWPVRPILPVVSSHSNAVQHGNNGRPPSSAVANESIVNKPSATSGDSDDDDTEESDDETESDSAKQQPVKPTTEAPLPKKKPRNKHRKGEVHHDEEHSNKHVNEQLRRIKTDMEMEFMDHDGAAERPSGAVLSLTLGLIVTAALVVLVGCRATVVRRRVRGRAGKGPYAHDADFLVNGMYL